MSQPIRLLRSRLTGRVYVVTAYTANPDGTFIAKTKHDVTEDFEWIMQRHDVSAGDDS